MTRTRAGGKPVTSTTTVVDGQRRLPPLRQTTKPRAGGFYAVLLCGGVSPHRVTNENVARKNVAGYEITSEEEVPVKPRQGEKPPKQSR
jgi:hypothetical protein